LSRCQNRGRGPSETAIRACLRAVNADPKRFRLTKSADAILAAVRRCCLERAKANHVARGISVA
jgi:hypothetical protein